MLLITRSANDPEVTITVVPGWGNGVTFDSTGKSIGMTVSSEGPDHIYLGDAAELTDTRFLVTSYVWQQTRPGEVAAVMVNEAEESWNLNTFVFDPPTRQIRDQAHIAGFDAPRRVRDWTDIGFVVSGSDEVNNTAFVEFVDPNGNATRQATGDLIDVSVSGDLLVSDYSNEAFGLRLVSPDGSSGVLDWAPSEFNAIRWSTKGEMIAFVRYGGDNSTDWRLDVYSRDGSLINSEVIPWRVWDVQWSPDERFVLMPGSDNQGTHAVIFYDRHTDTLSAVDDFQDWVQWSDLRQ